MPIKKTLILNLKVNVLEMLKVFFYIFIFFCLFIFVPEKKKLKLPWTFGSTELEPISQPSPFSVSEVPIIGVPLPRWLNTVAENYAEMAKFLFKSGPV